MRILFRKYLPLYFILLMSASCKTKNKNVSDSDIQAIHLKKGEIILCGPPDKNFGSANFEMSCSEKVKADFNLAITLLHSFEYDESEKVFAKIIDEEPQCAMAYWGVAMSNFHPLWAPSSPAELEKGAKAIAIARSLNEKSERESDYIEAIAKYYQDWGKTADHIRSVNFEKAMEKIYEKYPGDKEAAIFYALALDAAAEPSDKSYANQRKAGTILNAIYTAQPNHPGIVHYIIHTYDYPGLAQLALPAARKYAGIAPASAHAQHMPSHIFTQLGLWDESIKSNLISIAAAKCYAENGHLKGHWDEELHGMDYLEYAYLQIADDSSAKEECDYLKTIKETSPQDFKVAYAFAAIPARYTLEKKMWKEAARLPIQPANFPWEKFPWQKAIVHFARILGMIHTGNLDSAMPEIRDLKIIYDTLMNQKDKYKANLVDIQIRSAQAWLLFKNGKNSQALRLMDSAASQEDATEKHPVTPGEVIPARELLGDMLLEMGDAAKALQAYQMDLENHPNRLNGLYGAGLAAEKSGDFEKAKLYYRQLSAQCTTGTSRAEVVKARFFLKKEIKTAP
jgi:tetratricopeptide (TPR) repeat protein